MLAFDDAVIWRCFGFKLEGDSDVFEIRCFSRIIVGGRHSLWGLGKAMEGLFCLSVLRSRVKSYITLL